jgi:hypothetical protein
MPVRYGGILERAADGAAPATLAAEDAFRPGPQKFFNHRNVLTLRSTAQTGGIQLCFLGKGEKNNRWPTNHTRTHLLVEMASAAGDVALRTART